MENLIEKIKEAEMQAGSEKADAEKRADEMTANALFRVKEIGKTSAEVVKAYRDTQIAQAETEAEGIYSQMLESQKKESEEFVETALSNAEEIIEGIVGRIVSGNC